MSAITSLWVQPELGLLAVQLDEETIVVTNYATDPPTCKDVATLDIEGWTEVLSS